ncbi:hypothetical protein D477_011611 [Arthrobacter crystallopoietes BAB-32]|uniref:Uncharacterized protein n=1 Tax=Arthrobacter crystallopoietes BAB-32 TaxID=1246476 RepID=N1V731_9MICC|nr:hypothetical protein D477_011611 [Arthrobacter crystallopoietes BAB-32]
MNIRTELDGLEDGDGHFEVVGSGPAALLRYHLRPPYGRSFQFVEPLNEIASRLASRAYRQSAAGSGATPLGLFTIHVWESALTAPEGHTMMVLSSTGVRVISPENPGRR